MTNRIANTAAKIPAASSGPRQLRTMLLPGLLSDMVEQLPLILAVRSHCLRRKHMGPVPNAIELPQAAAQFLRNFCPRLNGRLGTPPPSARKLIEIFAIRAIAANHQPFAMGQSCKQTEIRRAQGEPQFALLFQSSRQGEPFVLGTHAC